jgi:hypothetical protein
VTQQVCTVAAQFVSEVLEKWTAFILKVMSSIVHTGTLLQDGGKQHNSYCSIE